MSDWFSSALDTIKGYGTTIGDAAVDTLKGAADATVSAAVDSLKNAGTPKSAVAETHKAVQVGENANGSTVVPLPQNTTLQNGSVVAAPAGGIPTWVWYVMGGSVVVIVAGITYHMVTE